MRKIMTLCSAILFLATSANARIIEISNSDVYYGQSYIPNTTGVQIEIELGDTIDFYAYSYVSGISYSSVVSIPMNNDIGSVYDVTSSSVLVARYIPTATGSYPFEFQYYGSYYRILSGYINVINPVINLNSSLLEAQYQLDGDALDASGNNHNGNLFGPVASMDRFGNPTGALSFQNGDFVDINDGVFLNQSGFAISFWFKLDQVASSGTMIAFSNDLKFGFNGNNIVEVTCGTKGQVFSWMVPNYGGNPNLVSANTNPLALNTWHNIILSCKRMVVPVSLTESVGFFGGNFYELFLNGTKVYSSVNEHPYNAGGNNIRDLKADLFFNKVLSPIFGTNFVGHLDDISVWGSEINELEATQIYTSTSVGIDEIKDVNITIYPNPTNDFLSISTNDIIENVQIFDMNGRLVLSEKFNSKVDVSKLENGVYTVVVNDVKPIKFIKN